jgi:hypothetical protein
VNFSKNWENNSNLTYTNFPKIYKCVCQKTKFFCQNDWVDAEQRTIQLDKCTCFCEWHVFAYVKVLKHQLTISELSVIKLQIFGAWFTNP